MVALESPAALATSWSEIITRSPPCTSTTGASPPIESSGEYVPNQLITSSGDVLNRFAQVTSLGSAAAAAAAVAAVAAEPFDADVPRVAADEDGPVESSPGGGAVGIGVGVLFAPP